MWADGVWQGNQSLASDATNSAAAAVIGRRPGAGAAIAIIAQSLGACVFPADNAAGLLEFGTRDELAAAERMWKVALLQALDDAASVYNHLRFGFGQRRGGASQSGLIVVIIGQRTGASLGGGRSWRRWRSSSGSQGRWLCRLGGRTTIDLDILVRTTTTLLATCCWRC